MLRQREIHVPLNARENCRLSEPWIQKTLEESVLRPKPVFDRLSTPFKMLAAVPASITAREAIGLFSETRCCEVQP